MKVQRYIRTWNSIYPPYLLLLAILPWLTGVLVNYPLSDSRNLFIALAWIPAFSLPSLYFNKRWIYLIACVLFFIMGFLEMVHWLLLKGPLSTTSLLVTANTNTEESLDFIRLKAGPALLWLLPYVWIFFRALKGTISYSKNRLSKGMLIAAMLYASLFIGENIVHGRLFRKGVPHVVKVAQQLTGQVREFREFLKEKLPREVEAETVSIHSQVFVLVLGESCNRKHMSMYGYRRKTNPQLEKRRDIVVFDNVVSPYSNTMNSVLSILSSSNLQNHQTIGKSVDLIDIMHSAGYKTFWLSNQSPIGVWDNMVSIFARKSDVMEFVNTSSSSSFEATNMAVYDQVLFAPLQKALADSTRKKFIVLHLMGSHSAYEKRYPSRFARFSGRDRKSRIIAAYDNSILYNDFVVDSIFSTLEEFAKAEPKTEFAAIYLSDHGENVFDHGEQAGHDYSGKLPRPNVEIPFILWYSEAFRQDFQELCRRADTIKTLPYVSDDLFHAILDLNAIRTPYFEAARSIFNPSFDRFRKRILEDGHDYDAPEQ